MVLAEVITLALFTIVLAKSSTVVVENAEKLARFFGISTLAIGLLLVAAATSLPELAVSVSSAAAGEGAIAAGNVFGSNIANILLILGIGAFIYGFRMGKGDLKEIALVLLLTTVISAYIIFHSQVAGEALGFYEGLLLIVIGAWYAARMLRNGGPPGYAKGPAVPRAEGLKAFLWFCAGVVLVIVSSSLVVSSAITLADALGLSKSFIGATIIAIGTSLPELSVTLAALRRRKYGMALGNAIGSNMVNLTLVLGAAAVISPILVRLDVFIAALLFAVIANMVFMYLAATKKEFDRHDGALFLVVYGLYLAMIFFLQFGEV